LLRRRNPEQAGDRRRDQVWPDVTPFWTTGPLRGDIWCGESSSPFTLAQSASALRTVRGFVNTACIALVAARWVPSPKAPASAVRIACWSRSVNRGVLGCPFGLPDCPGFQDRRFLRLAAFGINSENTTGSLFHHCSERAWPRRLPGGR